MTAPEAEPCHFLLDCAVTADPRRDYMSRLTDSCKCDHRTGAGGEVDCADFFTGLDPEGKAFFMLGGIAVSPSSLSTAAKRYVALTDVRALRAVQREG